jgi:hypothetical protein
MKLMLFLNKKMFQAKSKDPTLVHASMISFNEPGIYSGHVVGRCTGTQQSI